MRVKPKKRLGQNFLVDKNIERKIIANCEFNPSDTVLEIGAGSGEMTRLIYPLVKELTAIEIDPALCGILKENLKGADNLRIINADILKFDFESYFGKIKKRIKVVGNIPYYITTPIIQRLLEYRGMVDSIFITVQKEFALRASSCPGSKDYGSLSCFVQYYTQPKIMFTIAKNCFRPKPKVTSCLLKLKIREEPAVKTRDEKLFFKIIRAAFNKRRKTLRNSLRDVVALEKLETFFAECGRDKNIRPECLALSDFANLERICEKKD